MTDAPAASDTACGLFPGVFRGGVHPALTGARPPGEQAPRRRCRDLLASHDLTLWPERVPLTLGALLALHAAPRRFVSFFRTVLR